MQKIQNYKKKTLSAASENSKKKKRNLVWLKDVLVFSIHGDSTIYSEPRKRVTASGLTWRNSVSVSVTALCPENIPAELLQRAGSRSIPGFPKVTAELLQMSATSFHSLFYRNSCSQQRSEQPTFQPTKIKMKKFTLHTHLIIGFNLPD